jgi:hypothetical protein
MVHELLLLVLVKHTNAMQTVTDNCACIVPPERCRSVIRKFYDALGGYASPRSPQRVPGV